MKTPRGGKRDNLTLIDGVGDKLERDLNSLGIFHYDQIAAWTPAETAWINRKIGFPGRVERENWIGKAAQLKSGARTDFTRRVEAGKVQTSHRTGGGTGSASSGSARTPAAPLRGPAAKITSAASKPATSVANVASNIANAASAAATPTIKAAASTVTGAVVKAETAAKKAETAVKSAVKSTTARSSARKPTGKK